MLPILFHTGESSHIGWFAYQTVPNTSLYCTGHLPLFYSFIRSSLNKVRLVLDKAALDEMGNRIDELEQSINDLRAEMGQDGAPSPSASLKPREEPKTPDDSA